jgi:hypothetical protein
LLPPAASWRFTEDGSSKEKRKVKAVYKKCQVFAALNLAAENPQAGVR